MSLSLRLLSVRRLQDEDVETDKCGSRFVHMLDTYSRINRFDEALLSQSGLSYSELGMPSCQLDADDIPHAHSGILCRRFR